MTARSLARILGVFVVTTWALLSVPIAGPSASADPCADVSIVFARGTHQEPGLGNVGQSFVDLLTADLAGRSVEVYAVNYPANDDYHRARRAVPTMRALTSRAPWPAAPAPRLCWADIPKARR